jgi:hypothetical protein
MPALDSPRRPPAPFPRETVPLATAAAPATAPAPFPPPPPPPCSCIPRKAAVALMRSRSAMVAPSWAAAWRTMAERRSVSSRDRGAFSKMSARSAKLLMPDSWRICRRDQAQREAGSYDTYSFETLAPPNGPSRRPHQVASAGGKHGGILAGSCWRRAAVQTWQTARPKAGALTKTCGAYQPLLTTVSEQPFGSSCGKARAAAAAPHLSAFLPGHFAPIAGPQHLRQDAPRLLPAQRRRSLQAAAAVKAGASKAAAVAAAMVAAAVLPG